MPTSLRVLLVLTLLATASACLGAETLAIPWSRSTFDAMEGCQWRATQPFAGKLSMNGHVIGPPAAGQRYEDWLAALREYRQYTRAHVWDVEGQDVLLTFDGVRAWIRTALQWALAADLMPGEQTVLEGQAQRLAGNDTLCAAFDWCDRGNGAPATWRGWSEVRATVAIARDGAWHDFRLPITVPEFDHAKTWARPIFGMDGTHDTTRGTVALRNLRLTVPDTSLRRAALKPLQAQLGRKPGLDDTLYQRPDLRWVSRSFVCGFVFVYDHGFWEAERGRYRVAELLDEAQRDFGGYDSIVLWHAYPRIGTDDRNQFDFFSDMPGGTSGLRECVSAFHRRGVRVFIPYNPWDTSTRRPPESDVQMLARTVADIGADGVFMDTMVQSPAGLRPAQDRLRRGVAFEPEGHPSVGELEQCNASWAQGLRLLPEIGVLSLKWLEPRHMQHEIDRWATDHTSDLAAAWFNGSGMLVWENIFGSWNPWRPGNRATLRRMAPVWRAFADLLSDGEWLPYCPLDASPSGGVSVPAQQAADRVPADPPGVYASSWQRGSERFVALVNRSGRASVAVTLEVPAGAQAYDVWRGVPLRVEHEGDRAFVRARVEQFGGVAVVTGGALRPELRDLLAHQRAEGRVPVPSEADDPHVRALPVADALLPPAVVATTHPSSAPMLPIAGVQAHEFRVQHQRRECGCYPDPDTPPAQAYPRFLAGYPFDGTIEHDIRLSVPAFSIGARPVTNAEFAEFLAGSGYHPRDRTNFLRHWPSGVCPASLRDQPVVYLDLDDARAYARWRGQRLPTEWEWHLAAEQHLASEQSGSTFQRGQVWEWTESERDDGHTRFVMLRGGSAYRAEGSIWYFPGGAQPIATHAKFLRMYPGLDRCATVGFRCVSPR